MHFQSMIAHPVRGHPMANAFDDQTRDAAEVLMASISTLVDTLKSAREYVSEAVDANGGIDGCEIHYRHDLEAIDNAIAKFGVAKHDRKSVGEGKRGSVSVNLGGGRGL